MFFFHIRVVPVGARGRRIVYVAWEEESFTGDAREAHGMVLLAALATEVRRIQPLVLIAGQKLLAVHRHDTAAWRFQGREGVASARNELMQLEGEKTSPVCIR
ncbi:MAG: hypothetical protein WBP56_03400, partial [Polyangia bacterium]